MTLRNKRAYCLEMPTFETQEEWVERMEKRGDFIPKGDLKDNTIYIWNCRNGTIGVWVKEFDCFLTLRTKHGHDFLEETKHPRDVTGNIDPFIPHATYEEIFNNGFGMAYFVDANDKHLELKLTKFKDMYEQKKILIEELLLKEVLKNKE